jgi:hypothetical protein
VSNGTQVGYLASLLVEGLANMPAAKRILASTDKSIAWLADLSHRAEAIELLV